MTVGGTVYHYAIKGDLFQKTVIVNNASVAFSWNTNHTFSISKTVSLQFNLSYISKRPTAQGRDSRFFSPNVSLKKTFWRNKWNAVLQWQNVGLGWVPSNEQRITTSGTNFYTTTNYVQEKDILLLQLGYNFSQQNRKIKLPSSEFGEREF
jgi:hypothetical protein